MTHGNPKRRHGDLGLVVFWTVFLQSVKAQLSNATAPWTPLRIITAANWDMSGGPQSRPTDIDLPRPIQTDRRMLVMINAYHFNASESHVPNSLEMFTGLCEKGEEVHIALHTTSPALAPYVFGPNQRFFCQRLGISLPIIVYQYDPAIKLRIAGVHRELVATKLDMYDWFMYTEDDLALRPHNIDYLKNWTPRLVGGGILPHLMRYEVASLKGFVTPETKQGGPATTSLPSQRNALLLVEYPFPVKLVRMRRHKHAQAHVANPYMAMWALPQNVLAPFVAKQAWLDDIFLRSGDTLREYFAISWLVRHYKFGVPVQQMGDALVHHVSTQYSSKGFARTANRRLDTSHPLFLHEIWSQDAWDFEDWLRACIKEDTVVPDDTLPRHRTAASSIVDMNMSNINGRCSACFEQGKGVVVDVDVRREGEPMTLSAICR